MRMFVPPSIPLPSSDAPGKTMRRSVLLAGVISLLFQFVSADCLAQPAFQPPGLNAGDQYRIVFATSEKINGQSADIADYNAFVQLQAASSDSPVFSIADEFSAVVSTATVDARDNTSTNDLNGDPSVPIYTAFGDLVANDNADFYDGATTGPIAFIPLESAPPVVFGIWTGSEDDGTAADGRQLGQALPVFTILPEETGLNDDTIAFAISNVSNNHLLGLSAVLTAVGDEVPATNFENLEAVGDAIESLLADSTGFDEFRLNRALSFVNFSQQDQFWLQPSENRLSNLGGNALASISVATLFLRSVDDPRAEAIVDSLLDVVRGVVDAEIEFATDNGGRSRFLNRAIGWNNFADSVDERIGNPVLTSIAYRRAWLFANFSTRNQ